jgi:hypothetical protein
MMVTFHWAGPGVRSCRDTSCLAAVGVWKLVQHCQRGPLVSLLSSTYILCNICQGSFSDSRPFDSAQSTRSSLVGGVTRIRAMMPNVGVARHRVRNAARDPSFFILSLSLFRGRGDPMTVSGSEVDRDMTSGYGHINDKNLGCFYASESTAGCKGPDVPNLSSLKLPTLDSRSPSYSSTNSCGTGQTQPTNVSVCHTLSVILYRYDNPHSTPSLIAVTLQS